MPRISFLYRTDTHASDKSPVSWKGDYPAEIWDNLKQVGDLAVEHDADAVLDGGDYFHVKSSTRNPHSLVVKTALVHRAYPCPVFAIPGNHDVVFNNMETLPQQPLGVLFSSSVFFPLIERVFRDGDLQVRVVGMPYSPFRTLDELKAIQKRPGDDYLIAVVHQLAGADPPALVEEFFGEPVFRYDDLVTPDGPDVWCFGHWHKDQGIVDLGGKQFVNLGAVSRGALIKENILRTPKVALIEATPDRIDVRPYPLVVIPAAEVFDLERKARQEREDLNIEQFALALAAKGQYDSSVPINQFLADFDFAKDVVDLAKEYLERARSEVG